MFNTFLVKSYSNKHQSNDMQLSIDKESQECKFKDVLLSKNFRARGCLAFAYRNMRIAIGELNFVIINQITHAITITANTFFTKQCSNSIGYVIFLSFFEKQTFFSESIFLKTLMEAIFNIFNRDFFLNDCVLRTIEERD